LINGKFRKLENTEVEGIIHLGGTILKSSRSKRFREKKGRATALKNLVRHKIDTLIVIGGNGSIRGAFAFAKETGFPVVCIPKTIDNDVPGTDYTIGFDTALNNAVEAIDKIRISAGSHNRTFFIEVMGRDAGHIALHAGIATASEVIMIPETISDLRELNKAVKAHYGKKRSPMIVIVAEGDDAGHAVDIARKIGANFKDLDPGVSVLGYIQRGGKPSVFDRYLATAMGVHAAEFALKGGKNMFAAYLGGMIKMAPASLLSKKDHPIDKELLSLARKLGQIV